MDAGNPFLQFGLLVQVVIAFVGLFVLRPVPGIATVEPNIAEVSRQLCGVSHQPPQLGLIYCHIGLCTIQTDGADREPPLHGTCFLEAGLADCADIFGYHWEGLTDK